MSVVPSETCELKAGHPPAVKVAGGVRITQNKISSQDPKVESKAANDSEEEEVVSESPPKLISNVSGAPVRGNEDFPTASVKAYHEKTPLPNNVFRPIQKNNHSIHQPKK